MSGVNAVYSFNKDFISGKRLIDTLYSNEILLNHRGESGAGMVVVSSSGKIKSEYGFGHVRVALPYERVKMLSDTQVYTGIGHTHYAKEEVPKKENLQPIPINTGGSRYEGYIAADSIILGQNELRSELKDDGKFNSTTGAEIIGRIFLKELERTRDVEESVKNMFDKLRDRGIYSFTMLIRDKENKRANLLAVRDPKGGKPLCYGSFDGTYIISSETYPLEAYEEKIKDIKEIPPGGMLYISENGPELTQIEEDERRECGFERIYFGGPEAKILRPLGPKFQELYKKLNRDESIPTNYTVRNCLGICLSELYPELRDEIDVLVPVPESGRGVTKGLEIGYGIRQEPDALRKTNAPRTYQLPDTRLRAVEVPLKLVVLEELVRGKRVGIGDDSIVRGGMSGYGTKKKGVIGVLKYIGGVKEPIHMFISYGPMPFQCFRDFDPVKKETLAAEGLFNKDLEEINEIVSNKLGGGDIKIKVHYQSPENVYDILGDGYCTACMDGRYPVSERFIPEWIKRGRD